MHLSNFCKALIFSVFAAFFWSAANYVWNYFGENYWYYDRLIVCLNWNWLLILIFGGCDSIIKHRLLINGYKKWWRLLFWTLVGLLILDLWNIFDAVYETFTWLHYAPKGWAEVHAVTEKIYSGQFEISNLTSITVIWGMIVAGSVVALCWITDRLGSRK